MTLAAESCHICAAEFLSGEVPARTLDGKAVCDDCKAGSMIDSTPDWNEIVDYAQAIEAAANEMHNAAFSSNMLGVKAQIEHIQHLINVLSHSTQT